MEEKEKIEEKPKNTHTILKVFAVIILIFSIVALVYVKIKVPTFPLVWIIVIGVMILIIGGLVLFGSNLMKRFREKGEIIKSLTALPKPASLGELLTISEQAMTDKHLMNHSKGCVQYWFETLPKSRNIIFVYETRALYDKDMKKGIVYILINTHYPNDRRVVLIDPGDWELKKRIHSLGTEVEEEPLVEETTITNPTLGVQTITKKPVVKKPSKGEESTKEEDLV